MREKRKEFDVPLSIKRGTPFQQNVWKALSTIPYGEIRTYKEVAVAVDSPKAVRAIGQANRTNPLPIVIPCHRVIGQNGKLTGYMGNAIDGVEIKRQLLLLEGYLQIKNSCDSDIVPCENHNCFFMFILNFDQPNK